MEVVAFLLMHFIIGAGVAMLVMWLFDQWGKLIARRVKREMSERNDEIERQKAILDDEIARQLEDEFLAESAESEDTTNVFVQTEIPDNRESDAGFQNCMNMLKDISAQLRKGKPHEDSKSSGMPHCIQCGGQKWKTIRLASPPIMRCGTCYKEFTGLQAEMIMDFIDESRRATEKVNRNVRRNS